MGATKGWSKRRFVLMLLVVLVLVLLFLFLFVSRVIMRLLHVVTMVVVFSVAMTMMMMADECVVDIVMERGDELLERLGDVMRRRLVLVHVAAAEGGGGAHEDECEEGESSHQSAVGAGFG